MNVKETILNSTSFKPDTLAISELYWKYLIRSILKGKNILLTGDSGSGKTYACKAAAKALGREDRFFIFNFGAMQDPKTSLTGTVQFSKERGTYFVESDMVRAIKTEGAIILLDELSPKAIAEAVGRLMQDNSLRENLISNAEAFSRKFDGREQIRQITQIYEKLRS